MKALQAYIDRQNKWNACFGNHTPYVSTRWLALNPITLQFAQVSIDPLFKLVI